MRSRATGCSAAFLLAAAVLYIATPCQADVISVNTICVSGGATVPCTTPSTLTDGESTSSAFHLIFTLPDNDEFLVAGSTSWNNTGGGGFNFGVNLNAEYLGNAINGNVPSQADTITFNDQQFANLDGATGGSFGEADTLLFLGSLGTGSNATAFYTVDGQPLPTMTFTPASPGPESNSGVGLSGLTEPVLIDWIQTDSFAAASLPGSQMGNSALPEVPEPGTFTLMLGALLALALPRMFRKQRVTDR